MEKIVFITDSRCPVARAAAAHLLSLGYRVELNVRDGSEVSGTGSVRVDLTDLPALTACFEACGDALYGVIHPAPPPVRASVEEATGEQWDAAFREGALAAMMVTRAAGARLAKLGRGALIYLGSVHAEQPMGRGFLYTMGCSATQMLCREAALDYGAKGVNCFYIRRGVMAHDLTGANPLTNLYSSPATRNPRGRLPEPGSLGELIAFLLTPGAAPLSGDDPRADEGMTLFYGHLCEGG